MIAVTCPKLRLSTLAKQRSRDFWMSLQRKKDGDVSWRHLSGAVRIACPRCYDTRWVCEAHPASGVRPARMLLRSGWRALPVCIALTRVPPICIKL